MMYCQIGDELVDCCRIGNGLADWLWIGRLAMDWQWIGDGLAMDWRWIPRWSLVGRFVLVSDWRIVYGAIDMSTICIGLAPWSRTGHELADWWRIGG